MRKPKINKGLNWVGLKGVEIATLIAICNAVAWKHRTSEKLKTEALAMAIRLDKTWTKL